MNLFENILNKAKTWVNYLASGQLWSDAYDWANPEAQDPIQRFFDDPAQDMSKKQALMDNLKAGVPTEVMKSYVTEKYYKPTEFKQVLPTVDPTFKSTGTESSPVMAAKMIWNLPANLYNLGAGGINLATTAYQEGIPETASMLGKWIVKWIGEWAQKVATTYQNEWLLSAVNKTAGGLAKYAVENPLDVLSPSLVKPAVWATGKAIVKTAGNVTQWAKNIWWVIKKAPSFIDEGIETGVEKIANKALGSSDGTAELFKATSPSYNVLAKSKDISRIKDQAKLADQAVIDSGYVPKTTTERVDAYKSTMKKIWDEVEKARGWTKEKYKSQSISDTIMWEVNRMKVNWKVPPSLEADVKQLLKEADFYKKLWDVSLPDLGTIRSNINAKLTFWDKSQFSDAYGNVMKKVIATIKEWEDAVLTKSSWKTTSDLLKKYGALRSMLDDIIKQDIKASRAKWLPIEESFGRISGLAEMAGGVGQLIANPKQALPTLISGGSKVLLGKVAGKIKDADYLIQTGYEKLLKSKNTPNGTPKWNPTVVRLNSNNTKPIKKPIVKPVSKPLIKNESKVKKPKPKSTSVDVSNKQQVSNLEKEYVAKMKKGKNLVIDSDKIKEQFSDYDPKNPTTVHEKSSELSKIYYENALKDPSYKKVVLTAWDGGSGKSEILVSGIPQDSGTLVFDWTGKNFKKIVSQYDQAKKAWKDAEIKAVYIDYNKAKQFNAKRDRTVAEDILADTHKGYRKTLLQIAKERPDIKISLVKNYWVKDKNWKAISRTIDRESLVSFLEAHQELE